MSWCRNGNGTVESNEMIVSARINYADYKELHRIRLERDSGKKPSLSELIREAITLFIGENNENTRNN